MKVGETYEVHWPHPALGDCGTPNQFQTPFYDGVFCKVGHKVTVTVGLIVKLILEFGGSFGIGASQFDLRILTACISAQL
jgi:hypothetical protein